MPTLSYEKWLETAINEYFIKAFDYNSFNNFNKIGSGGFGNVYSAHSELLGIVAIKKLRQDFDNDENTVDKFIREVINITKIAQHKNIIQFFGIAQGMSDLCRPQKCGSYDQRHRRTNSD
ncbi:30070_t:CDS:2 [Gigaspora margarita]|uniref:30070_t:CDS:1 n=1 Tax=Gigaspora margarita TaxID=4874 RepID=A0ABN7UL72_GIGMA|nr:30070_t:CDS:2 [Gigaspora margarita]